jgi:hypothetical protein
MTNDINSEYSTFSIKYWSDDEVHTHEANGYTESTALGNFRLFHPTNTIISVSRLLTLHADPSCTEQYKSIMREPN